MISTVKKLRLFIFPWEELREKKKKTKKREINLGGLPGALFQMRGNHVCKKQLTRTTPWTWGQAKYVEMSTGCQRGRISMEFPSAQQSDGKGEEKEGERME